MKGLSILIALVFGVIALGSYAGWTITCPKCHNSNANVKGNCVLRQRTGRCPEDYYPVHHNVSTCPWCEGHGKTSRLGAWFD